MTLHQDKKLFREAIQFTADQMGFGTLNVEKDYWVTYALCLIFSSEIGGDVVFKGGTSLSKCFGLIDRFSEDIDLIVLRRDGESDSKMKKKLTAVSNVLEPFLPETEVADVTRKLGMNRKTAHRYERTFTGAMAQLRNEIILESTWLGYHEPYTTKTICSFVGEMMVKQGQQAMAEANELLPFTVHVLEPSRTLCEKIMSLVRFSYTDFPIDNLRQKIRHTYDLHKLIAQQELNVFVQSAAFETMLIKVAKDDFMSFRNNNNWLLHHPNESLMFKDLQGTWALLKPTYDNEFKLLVHGELPAAERVLETLEILKQRMEKIVWPISI